MTPATIRTRGLLLIGVLGLFGPLGAACGSGGGSFDAAPPDAGGDLPDGDMVVDGGGVDANAMTIQDPQDLPAPDGDPALDIREIIVGRDGTGSPFVEFVMDGPWPPSDSWYSWYLLTHLFGPGSLVFTVEAVLQRHNGTRSTIVNGVAPSSVVVTESATGVRFTFSSMPAVDRFRCEAGIQKTSTGTRVTDVVEGVGGEPLPFPQ